MPRKLTSVAPLPEPDPGEMSEEQIAALLEIYTKRGQKIMRLLQKESLTDFQRARSKDLLRQIAGEIKALNATADKFGYDAALRSYKAGFTLSRRVARELGIEKDVNFGNRINTRSVEVLAGQIAADLRAANQTILRNSERFIRATQQRVIEDTAISRIVAGGMVEGETRRATSDAIYRALRQKLKDGQLIEINGRGYDPGAYAELVARTRTREAASQGTVNASAQFGMDLVQIDVHGDACPICRTRMGRVYSISGSHPEFPVLDAKPPYHPRCVCVLMSVTEAFLREGANYKALVALSRTPSFDSAKDATKWLLRNPERNIATVTDYRNFLKAYGT